MRSLRFAVVVLLTASSLAVLASCQPKPDAGSTPALSHADSLKLQFSQRFTRTFGRASPRTWKGRRSR